MKKLLKSKINQRIFKSLKKVSVVFLILIFSAGMFFVGGTNAGFLDKETSNNNSFEAGQLDIEVSSNSTGLIPIADASDLEAGEEVSREVTIFNNSTMDVKYKVDFEKVSGNDDLCDGLQVAINDGTIDIYTGVLSSLSYEFSSSLDYGSDESYTFKVSLPPDADESLEKLDCKFNFVFTAWQNTFPDNTQGWSDEEKLEDNEINSGEWSNEGNVVINEVMWMGSHSSPADEWIELKNMTNNNIDLSNWYIENAATVGGSITIPSGEEISANGFYLIANYNKTNTSSDLNVDVDYQTTLMSLTGTANGNLILKTDNDVIIDDAKGDSWPAGENGSGSSDYRSMQRKPVPGDGTDADNWFTVNHPKDNDTNYWDDEINNYGTPGDENLLPVVLNEFVANPTSSDLDSMPNGEWIELWNNDSKDWDVNGWTIVNDKGNEIIISSTNSDNDGDTSDGGETIVPTGGGLVVYVNGQFSPSEFFDNNSDGKLYLYAKYGALEIENDYYDYLNPSGFGENKAYQRTPDGAGPWADPDPTPGKKNKLDQEEKDYYRGIVFKECFDKREFDRESEHSLCKGIFLEYLGLLDDQYDDEMPKDIYKEMIEKFNQNSGKEDKDAKEKIKIISDVNNKNNDSQPEVDLIPEKNIDLNNEKLDGDEQTESSEGNDEEGKEKEDEDKDSEVDTQDEDDEEKDKEAKKEDEEVVIKEDEEEGDDEKDEEESDDGKDEEESDDEEDGEESEEVL